MSFIKIPNIEINGISTVVPKTFIDNLDDSIFSGLDESQRFVETVGISKRPVVGSSGICTSDLCLQAAEKLITKLNWDKSEISILIFVTQTPDYVLPATSCILQDKLGLSKETYAIDISLGCSGWVYGLSAISGLMQTGAFKRGLLLVGDTTTVTKSPKDKSTFPLFGDAGTATALTFKQDALGFSFDFGTDGSGFENIMIRDGGFRHPVKVSSFEEHTYDGGIVRNNLQSILNGANVFAFGISRAPKTVKALLTQLGLDINEIDIFLFHQANKMMNEKIRTKLNIPAEKVPYSLELYGNTSSASIPLTLCYHSSNQSIDGNKKIIACGFGVGLSWGSVYFESESIQELLIDQFE